MLEIVPAEQTTCEEIALFLQPIYAATYPNKKYGLTENDFRMENFMTPDTKSYLVETFQNREDQIALIAILDRKLVGTVSMKEESDFYDTHGFYVALDQQGKGLGKKLMLQALLFCKGAKPIRLIVAETSAKTIGMYEKWGFNTRADLGLTWLHWPEWPEGIRNAYICMELPAGNIPQLIDLLKDKK